MTKKQPVAAVIWDIDDVLLDTALLHDRSHEAALRALGLDDHEGDLADAKTMWRRLFWHFDQSATEPILRAILHARGIDDAIHLDRIPDAIAQYHNIWDSDTLAAVDGAVALVSQLRDKGVPQGVVSNGKVERQLAKLRGIGLHDAFPPTAITIEAHGTPNAKPGPGGLLATCKALEVSPASTIYVGDRLADVIAANLAGVQSVHFLRDPRPPEVLWPPQEGAIPLETPQHVIHTIGEIRHLIEA